MNITDETGNQPSTLDAASERFTAGKYQNTLRVEVTDGSLTIGIKKTSSTSSWTVFDNFELYYLGEKDPYSSVHNVQTTVRTPEAIYDLTGRLRSIGSPHHLTTGLYIIRKGEKAQKVHIRRK